MYAKIMTHAHSLNSNQPAWMRVLGECSLFALCRIEEWKDGLVRSYMTYSWCVPFSVSNEETPLRVIALQHNAIFHHSRSDIFKWKLVILSYSCSKHSFGCSIEPPARSLEASLRLKSMLFRRIKEEIYITANPDFLCIKWGFLVTWIRNELCSIISAWNIRISNC